VSSPNEFPKDIYTEPEFDVDTLNNLGPLTKMAGVWTGTRGLDVKPKAQGPKKQAYVETYELQPIDAQTNGPQLFYGLRYHTHIVKPEQVKTYHVQVGFWLWEPATETVIHTLSIPRAQTAMAMGKAAPNGLWHLLDAVPRVRVQDARVPHQGDDQSGRDLVLRRGHAARHPGLSGAFPPHGPKHAHQDRRAHAEPARAQIGKPLQPA